MRAPPIHFKVEQIKSTDPSFKPALVIVQVRIVFFFTNCRTDARK